MQPSIVPFNITLLDLPPASLRGLKPVTTLDSFQSNSTDFHEDGLFSSSIFGPIGDERRMQRVSYIDIKIAVFHPIIFKAVTSLKQLYGDVMAGTRYARFDEELADFIPTSSMDGGLTGFQFFLTHWKKIKFRRTSSTRREQNILLIEKYRAVPDSVPQVLTNKIVVIPAGLRDLQISADGRKSEDEINSLYRRLLALANTINLATAERAPEILDSQRYTLQLSFNQIYEHLNDLIEGKKKLFLGRLASRRIQNGTRNVITAMNPSVPYVGDVGVPGFNSTIIGLYQYCKATLPVTLYQIRRFLDPIFTTVNHPARLVNCQTLESEEVLLDHMTYDQWTTDNGLERVITAFSEESVRNNPVTVNGRYMALVYKGPDNTFRVMHSIDELPENRSKADVHPITLTELLYLSVHKHAPTYPLFVTRYPITGIGSIYASRTHLRVCLKHDRRTQLDEFWQPMEPENTAHEYPVIGSAYINSLIPHPSRLRGLGAD
jgi:hypothetical protein